MSPEIPRGSTLFFQKVELDEITPGETYLVMSDKFRGIRQLRKEPHSSQVRLVPKNIVGYDEVVIEQGNILQLYVVRSVLINK